MLTLEQTKLLLESDFLLLPGPRVNAEVVTDAFRMPKSTGMRLVRKVITLLTESAHWLTIGYVDPSNLVAFQEVLIRLLLRLGVGM